MITNCFDQENGYEVINTETGQVVDWFSNLHRAQDRAGFLTRPDEENALHVVRPAKRLLATSHRHTAGAF